MSVLSRIDELRKQHGRLSINKLEKECGLTRGSMAKWDKHAPSPDKVKKVADYFHVSAEYLLYGQLSEDIKKDPAETGEVGSSDAQEILNFIRSASVEDLREVSRYIGYLKSKRETK